MAKRGMPFSLSSRPHPRPSNNWQNGGNVVHVGVNVLTRKRYSYRPVTFFRLPNNALQALDAGFVEASLDQIWIAYPLQRRRKNLSNSGDD